MGLLVSDYVVVYTSRLIHSSRPVNSNVLPGNMHMHALL